MDAKDASNDVKRWEDLPGAVLSHLLRLAPYKRPEVKLVCQSWRVSINESIRTASLPAEDLDLLQQLSAVQDLTATGVLHCDSSDSAPHAANPWCNAHPSTLQRLRTLRLQDCAAALAQLADWQTQQMAAHSSKHAEGSGSSRPGLDSLQELHLVNVGTDVAQLLPCVLMGQAAPHSLYAGHHSGVGPSSSSNSSSSSAAVHPWPLQHLSVLEISRCKLTGHERELSVLQQLPALQHLDLSHCHVSVLPAAVCACTGLTQLSFGHNCVVSLTPAVSNLQCLKVLDLSCNTALFSLGSGFSSLSSLTELNLAGPNCLFKDPVHQHSTPASHSAAGGNVVSFAAVAGLGQGPPAGDAADASAPQLSHEQQLQLLPQLAQLTRLRKLSLAHNRDMLVLPASVCSLTQLEVLDVRSCSLRYLNEELWDCGGLRELLLGDNVLDELPDDIGRLQQLEVLDIGRCRSLWRLPSSLLTLPRLQRLVLATKAVGQHIVERLELRCPDPVEVEFDGDEEEEDSWDMSSDIGSGFGAAWGVFPAAHMLDSLESSESEEEAGAAGVPELIQVHMPGLELGEGGSP